MQHEFQDRFKFRGYEGINVNDYSIEEEEEEEEEMPEEEEGSQLRENARFDSLFSGPKIQHVNMGDSNYFCPVTLVDRNILWPCNGDITAAYREKVYFFSSEEALKRFIQSPQVYVAKKKPLKTPPIRLLIVGPIGSGKSTLARHLTNKIGLCHIQFQEYLHEMIIKKMKKKIAFGIENVDSEPEDFEMLDETERQNRLATVGNVDWLVSQTTASIADDGIQKSGRHGLVFKKGAPVLSIEKPELTSKDEIISSYLSATNPKNKTLPDDILLEVLDEFWKGKRFRQTGFVLEGFPSNEAEVIQMGRLGLYPSAALFLNIDADEAVKRLLPERIRKWKIKLQKKQEFKRKLKEYYFKERQKAMEARKKQLLDEKAEIMKKFIEMRKLLGQPKGVRFHRGEETSVTVQSLREFEASIKEIDVKQVMEEEFPEINVTEEEEEDDALDLKEYEETVRQSILNYYDYEQEEKDKIVGGLKSMLVSIFELDTNKRLTTVTYQLNKKLKPFLEKFRSLFEHVFPISQAKADALLKSGYKHLSRFDRWCPVMLAEGANMQQDPSLPSYPAVHRSFIYYLSSKEALKSFVRDPLYYLCTSPSKMVVPVRVAIIGPPKSGKTTIATRLATDLVIARISAGDAIRHMLSTWPTCSLSRKIFSSLYQGNVVSDALVARCLSFVLKDPMCAIRGYVLDGYPVTIEQVQAIESRDIQPLRIIYLQISKEQLYHCWQMDRENRLQTLHAPLLDSDDFLENRLSVYLQYEPAVHQWYKGQRNILHEVAMEKSRWWVWNKVVDVVMDELNCIRHHAEGLAKDGVASIVGLGITPQEFRKKLGPFEEFCPVSMVDKGEMVDCSRQKTIDYAAEFKDVYYRLAGEEELATFLNNHLLYVRGQPMPPKQCRPVRRSKEEAMAMFGPKQGLLGFCPVTYYEGDFMLAK